MYPATASGVRYRIGCPSWTLLRRIVEEMPISGMSKNRARSPPCSSPSAAFDGLRSGASSLRNRQRRQRQNPLWLAPLR